MDYAPDIDELRKKHNDYYKSLLSTNILEYLELIIKMAKESIANGDSMDEIKRILKKAEDGFNMDALDRTLKYANEFAKYAVCGFFDQAKMVWDSMDKELQPFAIKFLEYSIIVYSCKSLDSVPDIDELRKKHNNYYKSLL